MSNEWFLNYQRRQVFSLGCYLHCDKKLVSDFNVSSHQIWTWKMKLKWDFFFKLQQLLTKKKKQNFLPLPINYGDMGEISEHDRHTPCMEIFRYHFNISNIKVSIKESLSKCVINHCKCLNLRDFLVCPSVFSKARSWWDCKTSQGHQSAPVPKALLPIWPGKNRTSCLARKRKKNVNFSVDSIKGKGACEIKLVLFIMAKVTLSIELC